MYCSLDDIKATIPEQTVIELTDDDSLGEIDQPNVDEAISNADGVIDTYIGGRYSVPLPTVPPVINQCSCDIAVYHLYKRQMEDVPKTRRLAYKDAIRILEQIRDGKMNIPAATSDGDGFAFGVLTTSHFREDNA